MKTYKVEVTETVTKWYNESNELHRENGPAIEYASGSSIIILMINFIEKMDLL